VRALLGVRDFRLLFCARSVSLVGDGVFLVALAWETYALSDSPTALSLLGIALTIPLISLLVFGGVISDRYDRIRVMVSADVVRAGLLAMIALLALIGDLRLWQMAVAVAAYGAAQAFFDPASDAVLPQLLREQELAQGNAVQQFMQPVALRFAGPALGGALVGTVGAGPAFALDAATFVFSAFALRLISRRRLAPAPPVGGTAHVSAMKRELAQGFSYTRRHPWLWVTFVSAALAYVLFMGPTLVLLPFVVKHVLHGSSTQLGLVLGAGGLGAIASAALMLNGSGRTRGIVFVYVVWGAATLAVAGYGLATAIWQLMVACLVFNFLETSGTVVWATMKQVHVPGDLLGRVASLDWLISVGLLPVSLALTGPVSVLLGIRATLIGAGVLGALVTLAGLLLPPVRELDRPELSGAPQLRGGAAA